MNLWFILACASSIIGSLWSLSVKYGLEYFTANTFACWYSCIMALIISAFVYIKTKTFKLNKWGLGSGLCAGFAAVLLALSFASSPNPGYSMAVFRMQAILTTIASYFIFGAAISPAKVLGMVLALVGVILISISNKKHKPVKDEKNTENTENKKDEKPQYKYKWELLAIGAGIMMTIKDVLTKKGLLKGGSKVMYSLLWNTAVFQVIILLITLLVTNGSIKLKEKENKHIPDYNKTALFHIVLAGGAFAMYQFMVIAASKEAPNVGVVKAIDTLGIVITSIASYFLFNSSIDKESIIGMILVIGGVLSMQCDVPLCILPPLKSKFHNKLDQGKIEEAFSSLSWHT